MTHTHDPLAAPSEVHDAETRVAGAAVLSIEYGETAAGILNPDGSQFASPALGAVFAAAIRVAAAGARKISPATVLAQMHRDGTARMIGGDVLRLHDLITRAAVGRDNTEHEAQLIARDATRRGLLAALIAGLQRAQDPAFDPDTDLDAVISQVQQVALGPSGERDLYVRDHMMALLDRIENPDRSPLLPSPWPDFDRIVKLKGGKVILIAARPGGGKSLAGIKIGNHGAVEHGIPAAIFSMEMPGQDVALRMAADLAKIPLHRLDDGDLSEFDWAGIAKMLPKVQEAPLVIDDTERLTIGHMRSRLRWMASEGIPARYVIVDYVQLMQTDPSWGREGWERLGALSRELKILAGEFDACVIGLAQLNRGPEQRADKIPQASDLRGAGNLEQDADAVCLLWQEPDETDPKMPARPGEVDVIVDKNRNGPKSRITLCWQPHYGRIIPMGSS